MAKRELEDPSTTLAGNGLQKSSRASVQLEQSPAGEPLELTSVRLLHISKSRKLFNPVSGKQNESGSSQASQGSDVYVQFAARHGPIPGPCAYGQC